MAVAPYTAGEIDTFRERGDAFNRDMLQEYYEHFAGLIDMGLRSDNVPVQPMTWVADPFALQTTCVDK